MDTGQRLYGVKNNVQLTGMHIGQGSYIECTLINISSAITQLCRYIHSVANDERAKNRLYSGHTECDHVWSLITAGD